MKFIIAFFSAIWGFFTDSRNRPAVEAIVGVSLLVVGGLYGIGLFSKPDGVIFAGFMSTGTGLLITNAINNNAIDSLSPTSPPPSKGV